MGEEHAMEHVGGGRQLAQRRAQTAQGRLLVGMRRRMAQMNARMNAGMGSAMSAASQGGKDTASSAAPGPGQQPMVAGNTINPGKPGMNAQPNQNVLDAVKKVMFIIIN